MRFLFPTSGDRTGGTLREFPIRRVLSPPPPPHTGCVIPAPALSLLFRPWYLWVWHAYLEFWVGFGPVWITWCLVIAQVSSRPSFLRWLGAPLLYWLYTLTLVCFCHPAPGWDALMACWPTLAPHISSFRSYSPLARPRAPLFGSRTLQPQPQRPNTVPTLSYANQKCLRSVVPFLPPRLIFPKISCSK